MRKTKKPGKSIAETLRETQTQNAEFCGHLQDWHDLCNYHVVSLSATHAVGCTCLICAMTALYRVQSQSTKKAAARRALP
jgi:hypothetical protein